MDIVEKQQLGIPKCMRCHDDMATPVDLLSDVPIDMQLTKSAAGQLILVCSKLVWEGGDCTTEK